MSKQSKLPYRIKEKYGQEIANIEFILTNMENGHIYGMNGNHSKMDGSLQTNCKKLRKEIFSLLSKIQNGSDSKEDIISNIFSGKEL